MSAELNGILTNTANLVGQLATTGGGGTSNYNDLVNKPSINGVTLSGNKTSSDLGINIPTKVSQLQNDSHFVQQSAIPTKTSQLQNDSGFAYAANLATVATTGSYNNLTDKPTIPTKTSQLQNDSNFVSSSALATVATSGNYNDLTNKPTIPAAQVNSDWDSVSGVSQILNKPNLATVATSGNYNDLTNKPTIPAAQINSDWNSVSGVSQILNKPNLATVATSGSYDDLTNKPDIPSITDLTPDYIHTNISSNGMSFHKFGDMLFFSGYFTGSSIPRYTELFRLNGLACGTTYVPLVAVNNGTGYMEIYTSANGLSFRVANLPADISTNTVFSGCVKLV